MMTSPFTQADSFLELSFSWRTEGLPLTVPPWSCGFAAMIANFFGNPRSSVRQGMFTSTDRHTRTRKPWAAATQGCWDFTILLLRGLLQVVSAPAGPPKRLAPQFWLRCCINNL